VKGSGAIKVESGETKVVGSAVNQLFAQLLIGDRISIRALFVKSAVGDDFAYSFTYDGKTVSGTKATLETVTVGGVEYYAVTLDGFGASAFDVEVSFSATGYADSKFSVFTLAEAAEAAWNQQDLAEWVEVAKAVKNLSKVYNDGAENNMTPSPVEGTPAVTKYPLASKIQSNSLRVAPIMNGAVGLRFTFTLTEAPTEGINVEVGGLNANEMGNVTIDGNNVTADLYFNAAYGTEKVNILFLDGSTGYFCVNTSVAQIVSQCMNNTANSETQRANAAALLSYLQTVSATRAD
jgi:prepilin-type processing-associated H-X9-DG protein